MILVGATTLFPEQAREIQKSITFETMPEGWLPRMRAHHPGGDEQIKMLVDQFHDFAFLYDDMNFTPPYLSQIKCPTLIIHGDRDKYFPVGIPVEMFKAIPNSFLWIVPNGVHLPIWDALWSDQFLQVSKLFLADKF
jgi:pimeloyl-ACP methyl ester carboxylesterase